MAADEPSEVEDATWERMLAVNLTGTMRMCRGAIPLLRAAGGGSIVNVASVAAFNATPGSASYAPSKAGVVAYTPEGSR
ncbi:SDR family oxidoreductase [Ramlibacter terrae]|uniref:SDR family oxidoreductase n=1 Tax=Ramlibacter terrae TaxID=2732511 RepID=A0ABX6P5Y0_9BURK|nr:SDR family oxidoreductase [Ramlibacter terrae]